MTGTTLLSVRRASKTYFANGNEVRALNDVSVSLRRREMLAVFGPSGSGKTTLLMIAGLVDVPTSGEVLFDGGPIVTAASELNKLRAFRRQHIGFVFQRANLIPFLTALDNVQVALQINDVPKKEAVHRALDLLAQLNVDHRRNSFPQQLSGGEQQRVAIARALANEPSVILADEPTGTLDSQRGRQVIELFRQLADARNIAVCVVTHDLRSVDLFDRMVEMNDGAIVGEKIPPERAEPTHAERGVPFTIRPVDA